MHIAAIHRYPVKSLQGEAVTAAALGPEGLAGDREWGIVEVDSGTLLTAKRWGQLLDAAATRDDRTDTVTVTLPTGASFTAGDEALDAALSAWLGTSVALRRSPATASPYELLTDPVDEDSEVWAFATPAGSFVDLAHLLVMTDASLAAIAAAGPSGTNWSVHRFRPGVLVATDETGFVEDAWVGRTVHLGEATVEPFMACPRCSMPPRAQVAHGFGRDAAVAAVLRDHHQNNLGVYASVTAPGNLAVGDPVVLA